MRSILDGSEDLSDMAQRMSTNPKNDLDILLPLFMVFKQAIADTETFLQQAFDEITKLVRSSFWVRPVENLGSLSHAMLIFFQSFAGRSDPSVEKLQYLCHLNDCQQSAAFGLDHVHSVMKELLSLVPSRIGEVASAEFELLKKNEKDLAYLINCLADLRRKTNEQCQLVCRNPFLHHNRILSTSRSQIIVG